jgi:hypothetical protein
LLNLLVTSGEGPAAHFGSLETKSNWVINQVHVAPGAPESALEFLKVRLLDIIATAYSIVFRLLLSGFRTGVVQRSDIAIFSFILGLESTRNLLECAVVQGHRQFVAIESRNQCDIVALYPISVLTFDCIESSGRASDPAELQRNLVERFFTSH